MAYLCRTAQGLLEDLLCQAGQQLARLAPGVRLDEEKRPSLDDVGGAPETAHAEKAAAAEEEAAEAAPKPVAEAEAEAPAAGKKAEAEPESEGAEEPAEEKGDGAKKED